MTDGDMKMGAGRKSNALTIVSVFALLMASQTAQGEISYWPMNEGTGDIIYDSWSGNDGLIYGATWMDGIVGSALSFNGIDEYVDCGSGASTLFGSWDSFTLEAWIKHSESSTFDSISARHDDNHGTFNYAIGILNSNFVLIADQSYIGSNWLKGGTDLTDDLWYYVVGVYDNKNMKLYVNGKEDGSGVFPGGGVGDPSANLYIGKTGYWSGYPDNRYFNGIIDEVKIYDRALAESEILENYFSTLPPIEAGVDFDQETLNLQNKGKSTICYVTLPTQCNISDIDPDSILLEEIIPANTVLFDEVAQVAVVEFSRPALQ